MRRDVWYAFISEVVASHKFIREYGPEDDDKTRFHVYGAHKGKERAMSNATNSISRLQALQFMRKLLDDPIKLVPFSFLQNAPYGDIVLQTLAVNIWGGPLVKNFPLEENQVVQAARSSDEVYEGGHHVFDIDGSVYLRNWMRSPSWSTSASISFWKNPSMKEGVILSKNLVVAGMSLVERAAETCKQRYQVAEKTQATIDSAMIKGIPSNIDLFKVSYVFYLFYFCIWVIESSQIQYFSSITYELDSPQPHYGHKCVKIVLEFTVVFKRSMNCYIIIVSFD